MAASGGLSGVQARPLFLSLCACKNIYIYIYGNPPMNYRPSFCIVNTVSKQLSGRSGFCISQKLPKKPRFQENVSVNSFTFDVRSAFSIS